MAYVQTLEINDPAGCRNAFIDSDFEAFPKVSGNFLLKVTQVGMDRLWLARYSLSLPQVDVFTTKPERTVIGFLTSPRCSVRYCGAQIHLGDVIINRSSEAHQQTETGLDGGVMSLPVNEVNTAIESIIGSDFMHRLATLFIRPGPALMSRLLTLHKAVAQLAHDTPEVLELPEVSRALEQQLIHLMVRCLAEGAVVETTTGARRHDAIIAKFEDYLAAHPDQPLYLAEICVGIGVAERTLRAACEEQLGMGPIRYLTLRRMHLVHRALRGADAGKTNVTRIVTDHGFWELGRFSVAYRALFGETPSETLRRPRPAAINLKGLSSRPVAQALAFH
jgi:AraC-like DNA-binding protein